jgi:hypothetical protein
MDEKDLQGWIQEDWAMTFGSAKKNVAGVLVVEGWGFAT